MAAPCIMHCKCLYIVHAFSRMSDSPFSMNLLGLLGVKTLSLLHGHINPGLKIRDWREKSELEFGSRHECNSLLQNNSTW